MFKDKISEMQLEEADPNKWSALKKGWFFEGNGKVCEVPINGYNPNNCFPTKKSVKLRQKYREAEDEIFNIWYRLAGGKILTTKQDARYTIQAIWSESKDYYGVV